MEPAIVIYADLESVRGALEAAGSDTVAFGTRLVEFARGHGRLYGAHLYGDLLPAEVTALRGLGVTAVGTFEEGDGSAPESIVLALDAGADLARNHVPDIIVLVSDDAQLSELVRRWRRRGSHVIAVVPESLVAQEPGRSSDRTVSAEQLIAGALVAVPFVRGAEAADVRGGRERTKPVAAPPDSENYDWTRLVLLLRGLESKMPFVGMRWLKNKVLGPHNVGVSTIAEKQVLLNRAVDEGLVETYRVGNREEGGEPVTACRLARDDERVRAILAAHPASVDAPLAGIDEAAGF